MRKERVLFFLGLWVALLPYLGFPNSARRLLFTLSGIVICYLAYLFFKQAKARVPKEENAMNAYVDNIKQETNE